MARVVWSGEGVLCAALHSWEVVVATQWGCGALRGGEVLDFGGRWCWSQDSMWESEQLRLLFTSEE